MEAGNDQIPAMGFPCRAADFYRSFPCFYLSQGSQTRARPQPRSAIPVCCKASQDPDYLLTGSRQATSGHGSRTVITAVKMR